MCRDRKRRVTLISGAAHPDTINTVRTYCYGTGDELRVVPVKDGRTDMDALREMLAGARPRLYIQQPNFFGQFEDAEAWVRSSIRGRQVYHGLQPHCSAIMKTPRTAARIWPWARGSLGPALGWAAARIWALWPRAKAHAQAPRPHRGPDVDTDDQGRRACPEPAGP